MTTAVAAPETIPLDRIQVSTNVRKRFDQAAIKELAENIKQLGIINPITVRPSPTTAGYELVAGERRYRAALSIPLLDVPVRILELTDAQALEYQAAENIHRRDLTAIEEAHAYKTLLDAKRYTVAELASVVNKSEGLVYRALRLLELPAAVLEAIEDGKLTPAHGHQILRVPEGEAREDAVKYCLEDDEAPTAKSLTNYINNRLGSDLGSACFPLGKPYAGEVACQACPYNSGNQDQLFPGAVKGSCTNTPCYQKKTDAYWDARVAALKKRSEAVTFSAYQPWQGQTITLGGTDYKVNGPLAASQKVKTDQAILINKSTDTLFLATAVKADKKTTQAAAQKLSPKDHFIAQAEARALAVAMVKATTKTKMTLEDWRSVASEASNSLNEMVLTAILGEEGLPENATLEQAQQIVLLSTRTGYAIDETEARKLGVKVADVKKAARKAAELEYKPK